MTYVDGQRISLNHPEKSCGVHEPSCRLEWMNESEKPHGKTDDAVHRCFTRLIINRIVRSVKGSIRANPYPALRPVVRPALPTPPRSRSPWGFVMEYLEASGRLSGVRAARRAAREPFWAKTKPARPTAMQVSKVWCARRDSNPCFRLRRPA